MKEFKEIAFWVLIFLTVIMIIAGFSTDTTTGTCIMIIFSIAWCSYLAYKLIKEINKKKKNTQEVLERKKEFEEKGYKLVIEHKNNMLFVNESEKKFSLGKSIYNFEDLISAEIVAADDVITTTHTKKKASVGKALVGSVLFGGVGAIIGGGAGKERSTSTNIKVCDKLQIKLTLNSITEPLLYIDFIKKRTRQKGFARTYEKTFSTAENFLGIFQVIINNK